MARIKFLKVKPNIFFQKVQNKTGLTLKELARVCKVHRRTMTDWKNAKSLMPLSVFKELCKIGGIKSPVMKILPDFWHIQNAARKGALARYKIYGNPGTPEGRSKGGRIVCHKLLSNPELAKELGFLIRKEIRYPNKSPELAELIGILIGDGGITDYQVRVTLNKKADGRYADYIAKLFRDLFCLKPTVSEEKNENTCNIIVCSRNLVEYLIKLGLKKGNKIKQRIDIPGWIKRNKRLKIACLRGLIDTDGCFYVDIHKRKNKYYFNPAIDFSTHSLPLFLSVKKILRDLNYHPTGKKEHIRLRRKNEIIRYFKEIRFNNSKHSLKFKNFFKTHRNKKH